MGGGNEGIKEQNVFRGAERYVQIGWGAVLWMGLYIVVSNLNCMSG